MRLFQNSEVENRNKESGAKASKTLTKRHALKRKLLTAISRELRLRTSCSDIYLRAWWRYNETQAYAMIKDYRGQDVVAYWVKIFRWLSYEQDGGNGFNSHVTTLKHLVSCERQYLDQTNRPRKMDQPAKDKKTFVTNLTEKGVKWRKRADTRQATIPAQRVRSPRRDSHLHEDLDWL